MLAPLQRGQHTIHILATADASGFRLDVTYHITVGRIDQDAGDGDHHDTDNAAREAKAHRI